MRCSGPQSPKIDGIAPYPTGGAYSAPPEPLAGFGGMAPGKGKKKGTGEEKGEDTDGVGSPTRVGVAPLAQGGDRRPWPEP